MSYLAAVRYLESFVNYENISSYFYKKVLKLERIEGFLNLINNPQRALKCIHVAGTKGKGSTCAFIAYILRQAGFKVGLYTSPHLIDFRERIRILKPGLRKMRGLNEFEGMISKFKLSKLVNRLRPAIEKYNRLSKYGPLSFFEAYTSAALIFFKEEGVDFAVLETGLGGRLDATNVVQPLACAITPISYEHTDKLGHTLKAIAKEKAGIIKNKAIIISSPQEEVAKEVIRDKCKEVGARLYEVGRDIKYSKTENGFSVRISGKEYKNLKIGLCGGHQLVNATLALSVVESMRGYGFKVGVDSIRQGLYNTLWPGRCEVVAKSPKIILDGAQNAASAGVLKKAINENFRYRRLILILGVSNDKDIKGIAGQLRNLADAVILTRADHPRSADPVEFKKYFLAKGPSCAYITNSVKEAKRLALSLADKEDLILVTGSLFVVGEFRNDKTRLN